MTGGSDPRGEARAQAGGADGLAGTAPAAAQDDRNRPAGRPAGRRNALTRLWRAGALPVLSIVFAMALGAILMLLSPVVSGKPFDPTLPITAYGALVEGSIGKPELWAAGNVTAIGNLLVQAAPLMLGGLAVGLAFKAGLFNIGVAGQFLVGAFVAAVVGARIGTLDTNYAVPLTLLAAGLGGAAYGFIPGFLKGRTGAHEVVTTIMLNSIAALLLGWAVADIFRSPDFTFARTADVGNARLPILFGRNVHLGVPLAFLSIFLVKFLLDRTTLGFEIRTVGANPNAARYAGIRPVLIVTLTMSICGLLSGLAGGMQILGVIGFYSSGISANVGFDAITVALLGRSSPLGIMAAALLFGAFRAGQGLMQLNTNGLVPIEVIDVIQGLIILFLAADIIIRRVFRLRAAKGALEGEVRTVTQSWGEQGVR